MSSIEHTLVRDDEEIAVLVEYSYHRAHRGATDGRFGPKIEPDEPAYCEIESVTDEHGKDVELTPEEEDDVCSAAWEHHEGMRESYEEGRAEAQWEARQERMDAGY